MMSLDITRTQRNNLKRLASYLESLPADYSHFGMRTYFSHNGNDIDITEAENVCVPCGTSACAVGHGPYAGIKVRADDDSWNEYCDRAFGLGYFGVNYNWCFCSRWDAVDDTHFGAAARIRYLLKHGRPPASFDEFEDEEWPALAPEYAPFLVSKALQP